MAEKHTIIVGEVNLFKREESSYWQCSTFFKNKNFRKSTKEENYALAKEVAEDWFLDLMAKYRNVKASSLEEESPGSGSKKRSSGEKTFQEAAIQFEREYEIITRGHRSPKYVEANKNKIRLYLMPFFGNMGLSEVTSGKVQDYRISRHEMTMKKWGKPPARTTLHQEIVTLRQILKTAVRHGWLGYIPDLAEPYRKAEKISHRAWFSHEEYKQLYTATRERAKNPRRKNHKWSSEQLHDYVLILANTGLRPDEAVRLEHRDVKIVYDEASNETILEISVRGKRGVGYCKSTSSAVLPYRRLIKRNNPKPTDLLFPNPVSQRDIFSRLLDEEGLRLDREGNRRTAYSLRHTYICFRLMEGADIYQIAKNCRTSVEMIEKYYASHIKDNLNASAINVRKIKTKRRPAE